MSKFQNKRIRVRPEDVHLCEDTSGLAIWKYRGVHQRYLSREQLERIARGDRLTLLTTNVLRKGSLQDWRKKG
jgi:hypothetical protein